MTLSLYSYYRSSCAYRVRIALNHKKIPYRILPVNLIQNGGEQKASSFSQLNPMQQVPYLDLGDGRGLAQSGAIIQFLEDSYPTPPLLPADPFFRALARQMAELIGSGIQPIQNLGVNQEIKSRFQRTESDITRWNHDWIEKGLRALEVLLKKHSGKYCVGDQISIADCFLVPQLYNARRFNVDLSACPHITRIDESLSKNQAFKDAHPDQQPDCPPK